MPSAPCACASHNPPRRTVPFRPPRERDGGGPAPRRGRREGCSPGERRAGARDDSPPRPPRRAPDAGFRARPPGRGGRVEGGPAPPPPAGGWTPRRLRAEQLPAERAELAGRLRAARGAAGPRRRVRLAAPGPSRGKEPALAGGERDPSAHQALRVCSGRHPCAVCCPGAAHHFSLPELAATMLNRVTRLVPRARQLDPGHFLHRGPQGPQGLAVHLDDRVPDETPRAGSRLSEDDPAGAGEQREGRHYRIPLQDLPTVFPHGLPRRFGLQVKTFREACLMVRRPALELLRYLDGTNFAHPAVRYVLYGEKGTGKTLSLCHVIHFCAKRDWLVVHVPDAHLWVKSCRGLLRSAYNRQRFDQPVEASSWLKSFKTANERFLSQIKIQETYMWNKRESTEKGRPLGEVVEQGLTRVKNATDAVGIVLKELKSQSCSGAFRLLVAVDGVNALWGRTTLKREDKSLMAPEELALVCSLRKMVRNDWHGGAVVLALSQTGSLFTPRMAYLPQELLGKEGFDALDPFVPVLVSNYSPEEFERCVQYYLENSWLQHEKAHTEEGKKELLFLSDANPGQLERLCAYL
ncbi:28S ribosomal protein S29, mitochondrial isoform X2 [Mustela erminea]|uniref:28S ribosomal protein S29, mitochondrial isoform X2 n=1 Tax=Mustela erminea TaxID=36723 RepID=UPI001386C5CF|nr:28S ribosomal protein S29, mitochondrial isoform X2 [Mustela erminea]